MPDQRTRTPKAQRDGETEGRILQAARRVFVRRGTAGARMQDIAEEAGVNQALLHYHFRSKADLQPLLHAGQLAPLNRTRNAVQWPFGTRATACAELRDGTMNDCATWFRRWKPREMVRQPRCLLPEAGSAESPPVGPGTPAFLQASRPRRSRPRRVANACCRPQARAVPSVRP